MVNIVDYDIKQAKSDIPLSVSVCCFSKLALFTVGQVPEGLNNGPR